MRPRATILSIGLAALPAATLDAAAQDRAAWRLADASLDGIRSRLQSMHAPAPGTPFWASFATQSGANDDAGGGGGGYRTESAVVGFDHFLGPRLSAGLAVGHSRDSVDAGGQARANSLAAYASYQAAQGWFIDSAVGYARPRFEPGLRNGRQIFGSVGISHEHRLRALTIAPYARIDAAREHELGSTARAALGLRLHSKHETRFGWALPRARLEYRHELEGDANRGVLLGLGTELVLRAGLRLALDYEAQRVAGGTNLQGLRVLVSQELGTPGAGLASWEPMMLRYPLTVGLSHAWDDNVTRGRTASERLGDSITSLNLAVSRERLLLANVRLQATALVSGEKFERFAGLGHGSAGAEGAIQYRTSGAFDAYTFSAVGRAHYQKHASNIRTGPRYFLGATAQRSVTDRIDLFAEVGANRRYGRSEVFVWRDYSAKLNIDYSLRTFGTLYLAGELRRGDTVASGPPSLVNVNLAEVLVPDDAFGMPDIFAYRFEARSVLATLGWNFPLGARDSLDLSWRWVRATPTGSAGFDVGAPVRYSDNQYSITYLIRF